MMNIVGDWTTWTRRLLVVLAMLIGINVYAWCAHHFIFDRSGQQHAVYNEKDIRDALYNSLEGDVIVVTERRAAFESGSIWDIDVWDFDLELESYTEGICIWESPAGRSMTRTKRSECPPRP